MARIPLTAAALLLLAAVVGPTVGAGKAAEVRVHAFELLNAGVSAYSRGDYDTAIEKLEECTRIALSSFRAQFYLGRALIGARRYEEALEELEIALDLEPESLQALVARGDANLKLGRIEDSWAGYTQALKLRAAYAPALDGMARSYEARSDDAEAIRYYRQAIAGNPGFAPAYTHLGDLFLRQGRLQEAVHLLEEAVSIRADYAPGLNRLGLAYARLGLSNEAVATVQRAIELEPRNPEHPLTVGWLQLEQGFLQRAEDSFKRALGLGLARAGAGLAEVARRRGRYDTALRFLDEALATPHLEPAAIRPLEQRRTAIALEQARLEELRARTTAEDAAPEDFAGLALIHSRRGEWERAIELQTAAAVTPAQRERLAYMLFRGGHYRRAAAIYTELADGPNGGAAARVNLGVTLALLGDEDGAIQAYRAALEIEPDRREARLYLANALLRLGQRGSAARAYLAVLDQGRDDEADERIRRILEQIAPELLPAPPPRPPPQPADDDTPEAPA